VTRVIAVYKSVDRIQTSIMLGNFKNISVQQSVFESFCPVVCTKMTIYSCIVSSSLVA
jgi:hypothetical protein